MRFRRGRKRYGRRPVRRVVRRRRRRRGGALRIGNRL